MCMLKQTVSTNNKYKKNGNTHYGLIIKGISSLKTTVALAGVAQWIEGQPVNQRVTSSIPSQGMRLGCEPGPQ